MELQDTIAALASAPGPAWRGILRLSGPDVIPIAQSAFVPDSRPEETSLFARDRAWRVTGRWQLLDSPVRPTCDLLLWPTPRSYTGQPTAELHLPGSPPLLEKVLEDLYRRGARPACPGEFTLRAFLAGKIDLLQAEGVLGVIEARDDEELRTALGQLAGGISGRLNRLRFDLIDLLADLEAGLDFVEEEIEFVTRGEMLGRLAVARRNLEELIDQSDSRMTSTPRPTVVLAGLPNAGKSTLFNRLAGRPLALVSSQEGTTRDYLRTEVAWEGLRLELIDTAGWEEANAPLAAQAQAQRIGQIERATLIVWCSACDQEGSRQTADLAALTSVSGPVLHVWTKCDVLAGGKSPLFAGADSDFLPWFHEAVFVSAQADEGIDDLRAEILRRIRMPESRGSAWLGMTAARCRESLLQAKAALTRAEETAGNLDAGEELLAIDLREALDSLGQVVGAVYTDDLLDRIFSKFCIGK